MRKVPYHPNFSADLYMQARNHETEPSPVSSDSTLSSMMTRCSALYPISGTRLSMTP